MDGFFSAVFLAYARKIFPRLVCEDFQPGFGDEIERVPTDPAHAQRVLRKLTELGGKTFAAELEYALASSDPDRADKSFAYVRILLDRGANARYILSDPAVIDFQALTARVAQEVHRMKGFLRFLETDNGALYARYEPDHNITAFLMPHFCRRYASERFLIHDIRRNIVGVFDGRRSRVIAFDGVVSVTLSAEESAFADLFKTYYRSVNIEARRNLRQMFSYMPRRYCKNMPETL